MWSIAIESGGSSRRSTSNIQSRYASKVIIITVRRGVRSISSWFYAWGARLSGAFATTSTAIDADVAVGRFLLLQHTFAGSRFYLSRLVFYLAHPCWLTQYVLNKNLFH